MVMPSPVLGPINPVPSITGEQDQPGPRTFSPEPGPLITLSSPLLEGTNVTINGFITPLGENTTLKGVLIDWGDGKSDNISRVACRAPVSRIRYLRSGDHGDPV